VTRRLWRQRHAPWQRMQAQRGSILQQQLSHTWACHRHIHVGNQQWTMHALACTCDWGLYEQY